MSQLYVLEKSAEFRTRLTRKLSDFVSSDDSPQDFIPHVDFKPVSAEELQYLSPPDIFVVGPQILMHELTELTRIKKIFPDVPLLVCTTKELENLSTIEQMARMGADATLPSHATAQDFLRILIHLAQKAPKASTGKLYIVDGGKGGVGVTSVAAALAETCAREGKRTLIVDGDSETQDLARFLQARPYVNENLQLLLEGQKPLSREFIEQCYVRVWSDNDDLFCMPAMPDHDAIFNAPSKVLRQFLLIFETLDQMFDTIIVDMGSLAGMFQRALYRAADGVVFVLNDDPASLYGSVERLAAIREVLPADAKLCVVDNAPTGGLSRKVLVREFGRAAHLESTHWSTESLPFCKQGRRWPGSGATLASLGSKAQLKSCDRLAADLGLIDEVPTDSLMERIFAAVARILKSFKKKRTVTEQVQALPAYEDNTQKLPNGLTPAFVHPLPPGSGAAPEQEPASSFEGSHPGVSGATDSSKEETKQDLQDIITPASFASIN